MLFCRLTKELTPKIRVLWWCRIKKRSILTLYVFSFYLCHERNNDDDTRDLIAVTPMTPVNVDACPGSQNR